ncbi:hypothetical protein [Zobellella sp. An-6]|uniref:hypothetical protein n=1 Tax=Zobellella sp. An-6 TaxID=3400218 RepID=UPI004042FD4C
MKTTLKNRLSRMALLAGLAAAVPGTALSALDWNLMGTADGVEFYSARAGSTVRLGMVNTNAYPVHVEVEEGVVWCGSNHPGAGDRQRVYVGEKKLKAGGRAADPGWNHSQCDRKQTFYYELNGISVTRQ